MRYGTPLSKRKAMFVDDVGVGHRLPSTFQQAVPEVDRLAARQRFVIGTDCVEGGPAHQVKAAHDVIMFVQGSGRIRGRTRTDMLVPVRMQQKITDRVQATLVVELTPAQDSKRRQTIEVSERPLEPVPAQQPDITIETADDRPDGLLHETVQRDGKSSTGVDLEKTAEGTAVIAGSTGPCSGGLEGIITRPMVGDQNLDRGIGGIIRQGLVDGLQQVSEEVGGTINRTFPAILEVWNDDRGDRRQ